jgi:hypothetical protein
MVQRKPLSYRIYKEGSDPDAYICYFKQFGHDDAYCFNNLDNPNNRLSKTEAKGAVAVNEISVHSQGGNVGKQQAGRFGRTTKGGIYPRPTGCHICQASDHLMEQCT